MADGRNLGSRGRESRGRPVPPEAIIEPVWVWPRHTTLDNDGNFTAVINSPLLSAPDIMGQLIEKWGNGAPTVNKSSAPINNGANFGSFWWAESTASGDYIPFSIEQEILSIRTKTTMREVLDAMCANLPYGIHRKPDGIYYMLAYAVGGDWNRYYGQATSAIHFHPNVSHEDAVRTGRPYEVWDFRASLSPRDEIFNRYRLRYWPDKGGNLQKEMYVTEVAADSNVFSLTTYRNDGKPAGMASAIGFDMSEACRTSQLTYNHTRILELDLPHVHSHNTAFMVLVYVMKRFLYQRVIAEASVGTEAYDLMPGHITQWSRDINLIMPRPDYMTAPAQSAGWSLGDNNLFLVGKVKRSGHTSGVITRFETEQIIETIWDGDYLKVSADGVLLAADQDISTSADAIVGRFIKEVTADAADLVTAVDLTVGADAKLEA